MAQWFTENYSVINKDSLGSSCRLNAAQILQIQLHFVVKTYDNCDFNGPLHVRAKFRMTPKTTLLKNSMGKISHYDSESLSLWDNPFHF